MHVGAALVRVRFLLPEPADLRRREPAEPARSGMPRERVRAADGPLDLLRLLTRARIHPERRDRTRQHRRNLLARGPRGIESREYLGGTRVQVHAAVLLRAPRD